MDVTHIEHGWFATANQGLWACNFHPALDGSCDEPVRQERGRPVFFFLCPASLGSGPRCRRMNRCRGRAKDRVYLIAAQKYVHRTYPAVGKVPGHMPWYQIPHGTCADPLCVWISCGGVVRSRMAKHEAASYPCSCECDEVYALGKLMYCHGAWRA